MDRDELDRIYDHFIGHTRRVRVAWTAQCHGEPVALNGAFGIAFPLWPTRDAARHVLRVEFPNLEPHRLPMEELLEGLPLLALQGVPVVIGRGPSPLGVEVHPLEVFEDLTRGA